MSQLDRSIVILHDSPDSTPSRKDGICFQEERLQRLHGIGVIHDATAIMNAPSIVFQTASVIFHRFYHQISLQTKDVWSISMASFVLGCKMEEVKMSLRELIIVFNHLYRKYILCLNNEADMLLSYTKRASGCYLSRTMTLEEKKDLIQRSMTPLSPIGPIYEAWHETIVQAESCILKQMGFTLYWISDSHPRSCIDDLCKQLSETVKNRAHEACDRTFYIDSCVRFQPDVIAHAAVYVACRLEAVELPLDWAIGDFNAQDVSDLSNWILGLSDESNKEIVLARSCFLRSHAREGSFNDPGGLIWDFTVDFLQNSANGKHLE